MTKIPINISTGSLQKKEYIVGIDLGTTNSLISIIHPESKKPIILKEFDNTALVPSVLYFDKEGNIIVGDEAKSKLIIDPQNTIFSVKRLMGKSYNDIKNNNHNFLYKIIDDNTDNLVKIKINDKFYNPIELSAYILKELKKRAEHILKATINKAVITVPAYFNDVQRQSTKDAGKLAGLEVLRIINEPTAASLAYGIGLNKKESKIIAVYDLGGGTFDISILKINNGIFDVLSTNGDTYLGGDDIDNYILNYWIKNYNINTNLLENKNFYQELRLKAEEAKIYLSNNNIFKSKIENINLELDLQIFKNLIKPLISKTIECFTNAIKDAKINKNEIDSVLMVGGSTRNPYIKEEISQYINKTLNDSLNPDEVVALGAAIQADILAGNNKDFLLLDITPLSLGIETMGGLMDVLIPRNSKIPTKAGRQYTTHKDGQTGIVISVFQGERDLVQFNRKLGEFILKGIPNMPAGFPKIEITFYINVDGIMNVKAKELRTGIEQSIEIKPQYGITDQEVENMLLDSLENSKADMENRALIDAINEAQQIIDTTNKFIDKNIKYLTESEIELSKNAINEIKQELNNKDKNKIQNLTEKLNIISKPYAERIMDIVIGEAMKGKKI